MDSELSDKLQDKVGIHRRSLLSLLHLEILVDVVIKLARDGVLSELLYADDYMSLYIYIDYMSLYMSLYE